MDETNDQGLYLKTPNFSSNDETLDLAEKSHILTFLNKPEYSKNNLKIMNKVDSISEDNEKSCDQTTLDYQLHDISDKSKCDAALYDHWQAQPVVSSSLESDKDADCTPEDVYIVGWEPYNKTGSVENNGDNSYRNNDEADSFENPTDFDERSPNENGDITRKRPYSEICQDYDCNTSEDSINRAVSEQHCDDSYTSVFENETEALENDSKRTCMRPLNYDECASDAEMESNCLGSRTSERSNQEDHEKQFSKQDCPVSKDINGQTEMAKNGETSMETKSGSHFENRTRYLSFDSGISDHGSTSDTDSEQASLDTPNDTPYTIDNSQDNLQPEERQQYVLYEASGPSSDIDTSTDSPRAVYVQNGCCCTCCVDVDVPSGYQCCLAFPAYRNRLAFTKYNCITEHPGFKSNCLDEYVLEASIYDFVERYGSVDDDKDINSLLRYMAYRRLILWIFKCDKDINIDNLPRCAVQMIRQTFPSYVVL